jgi:type II secretory pathway pseudopilin PulG
VPFSWGSEGLSHERSQSSDGFSFVEMLVALTVALIVLGLVFGLLSRSTVGSTVENEHTDLQGQARHALETLTREAMLAGTDLPPEFPSFLASAPATPRSRDVGDRVEILGNFREDARGSGPAPVLAFDGYTARLAYAAQFAAGDVVLFFDDKQIRGSWLLGIIRDVRNEPTPEIDIVTDAGATVAGPSGSVTLPPDVGRYNRLPDGVPTSGYVTPISVVAYEVAADGATTGDEANGVLLRTVNWGTPVEVAAIESMEFRYFVGGTVSEPGHEYEPFRGPAVGRIRVQSAPEPPGPSGTATPPGDAKPPDSGYADVELSSPPVPQPDPERKLDANLVIRGVRITVTSRSKRGNLVGSEHLASDPSDATSYLRQTLSTRVAPRNLVNQAGRREMTGEPDATRILPSAQR